MKGTCLVFPVVMTGHMLRCLVRYFVKFILKTVVQGIVNLSFWNSVWKIFMILGCLIGVRAGADEGGCSPSNFRQLRVFGQQEKIWAKPVFKDVRTRTPLTSFIHSFRFPLVLFSSAMLKPVSFRSWSIYVAAGLPLFLAPCFGSQSSSSLITSSFLLQQCPINRSLLFLSVSVMLGSLL